jgi:hypothetical protein
MSPYLGPSSTQFMLSAMGQGIGLPGLGFAAGTALGLNSNKNIGLSGFSSWGSNRFASESLYGSIGLRMMGFSPIASSFFGMGVAPGIRLGAKGASALGLTGGALWGAISASPYGIASGLAIAAQAGGFLDKHRSFTEAFQQTGANMLIGGAVTAPALATGGALAYKLGASGKGIFTSGLLAASAASYLVQSESGMGLTVAAVGGITAGSIAALRKAPAIGTGPLKFAMGLLSKMSGGQIMAAAATVGAIGGLLGVSANSIQREARESVPDTLFGTSGMPHDNLNTKDLGLALHYSAKSFGRGN